ncbi:MAG TPA: hypothetical protein VMX17_06160 [Candidatus Glassbacteria bacterium]|nr:hypothetical protein [Candidatus Glassbacteria bacterium]
MGWYATVYEILRAAHDSNMPEHLKEEIKVSCKVLSKEVPAEIQKRLEAERENCAKLCREENDCFSCANLIQTQKKIKT